MLAKILCCILLAAAIAVVSSQASAGGDKDKTPDVLKFKMKNIDGKDVDLAQYKGKVVLFVNVASQCGYTPHYKGLEALHEKFAKEGLAVLGFPCNDFGNQEPGTETDIKKFCTDNYSVSFDMFSKVSLHGADEAPLYKYLTSKEAYAKESGDVKWNFELFLVARDGTIVNRFRSAVDPESEQVVRAIRAELNKK